MVTHTPGRHLGTCGEAPAESASRGVFRKPPCPRNPGSWGRKADAGKRCFGLTEDLAFWPEPDRSSGNKGCSQLSKWARWRLVSSHT